VRKIRGSIGLPLGVATQTPRSQIAPLVRFGIITGPGPPFFPARMPGKKRNRAAPGAGKLAAQIKQRWGGAREELALDRLEAELEGSPRYDIVAALKQLEEAGQGELQLGRKGHKPRFMWSGPGRKVAQSRARANTRSAAPPPPDPALSTNGGQGVLEHAFHVRPNVLATFRLPADVTRSEIDRLCQLLQALPFR
jgi:hypothetical protein